MATGQRARRARTRPRAARGDTTVARGRGDTTVARGRGDTTVARGRGSSTRGGRAAIVGALLNSLVILGGVVWLVGQHAATGGVAASAASGQPAPGRTLTLPATRGGALSLQQFAGRTVVLYFYEGST